MQKRKVRLADYRERRLEAAGLDIEMDDGQVFTIPPAELWPDDFPTDGTLVDRVRSILGERYDAFIAAGGTATVANAMWADRESLDLGEPQASPPS